MNVLNRFGASCLFIFIVYFRDDFLVVYKKNIRLENLKETIKIEHILNECGSVLAKQIFSMLLWKLYDNVNHAPS